MWGYLTDGDLAGGVVLGGDDAVGEVALAGQVDVGELVVEVEAALHFGVVVAMTSCFHSVATNILLFILSRRRRLPCQPINPTGGLIV